MKLIRKNLIFLTVLLAFSFGCNSQSGITDSNLDKPAVNNSGNGSGSGSGGDKNQTKNLPQFMTYAVIGGEEVTLNGSPIWVREAVDPKLNANVHSNNKVILNGKKIAIEGFVTYVDIVKIDGDNITIIPNNNPTNKPSHYKVSGVNLPAINVEDYKYLADIIYDGDKQLSGNINLGSQSDPLVIYVAGNLYLDRVTFNGYGIVIAEKEIEIVSNVRSSSPHPDHSKVFIVGGDKFKLNNSSTTLHASVYTKYEVNINAEDALIEGSLATREKNTLNGKRIDMRFKPVYSGLAEMIFGSK